MRKLAALLLVAALAAPALAQESTATPATEAASGQSGAQDATYMAAPSILDRVNASLDAGQYQQAIIDSSLFILLNPTHAEGYYLRGVSYLSLNQSAEGLKDLNAALPLVGTNTRLQVGILSLRAGIYAEQNQLPQALDDANHALEIEPSVDLYVLRARLLLRQPDYQAAITDLDSAIQLSPDEAILYLLRGSAYAALNRDVNAARDYLAWIARQQPDVVPIDPTSAPVAMRLDMKADTVYILQLNARRGQKLTFTAANESGNIDPLLILLSPSQQPVAANDDVSPDNPNATIRDFTISENGAYGLVIWHAGGGGDGRVLLTVDDQ